jgi:hypothetical protein
MGVLSKCIRFCGYVWVNVRNRGDESCHSNRDEISVLGNVMVAEGFRLSVVGFCATIWQRDAPTINIRKVRARHFEILVRGFIGG